MANKSQCIHCGEPISLIDGVWRRWGSTTRGADRVTCSVNLTSAEHEPTQCERCGELIDSMSSLDSEVGAEFYDPRAPEGGAELLHPDCVPDGWEMA